MVLELGSKRLLQMLGTKLWLGDTSLRFGLVLIGSVV